MGLEKMEFLDRLVGMLGKKKLNLFKKIRILSLKVYFSHVAPVLFCAEYSDLEFEQFHTLKLIFLEKRPNLPWTWLLSAGSDK